MGAAALAHPWPPAERAAWVAAEAAARGHHRPLAVEVVAAPLGAAVASAAPRPRRQVVAAASADQAAPRAEAAASVDRQHPAEAAAPPVAAAVSARLGVAAVSAHQEVAAVRRPGAAVAWARQEVAAVHRVASAAHREHPVAEVVLADPRLAAWAHRVARRPAGPASRAWPVSVPGRGRRRRGTAPTGSATASRVSAALPPPRRGRPAPGPASSSPPSTRGTRRRNRRRRPPPCCGTRRTCRRSW